MVGEWSQKVKECVLHFVISQAGSTSSTSSTCARASRAAVTCKRLVQPAVVHHWISSTQYCSWWGSHSYQHLQALMPVTLWGCYSVGFCPLQKYFKRSFSVGWWGVWMWSWCLPDPQCVFAFTGCGSDLLSFCVHAKTRGNCSSVVSSKILVPHCRSVMFHGCGKGLHHV